jgi:hypothetical protein
VSGWASVTSAFGVPSLREDDEICVSRGWDLESSVFEDEQRMIADPMYEAMTHPWNPAVSGSKPCRTDKLAAKDVQAKHSLPSQCKVCHARETLAVVPETECDTFYELIVGFCYEDSIRLHKLRTENSTYDPILEYTERLRRSQEVLAEVTEDRCAPRYSCGELCGSDHEGRLDARVIPSPEPPRGGIWWHGIAWPSERN